MDIKEQLELQATNISQPDNNEKPVKITKSMSIQELIGVMKPEIEKALSGAMSTEKFTRIAMNTLNANKDLRLCTPTSFLSALLSCAALSLEPGSVLQEAYLLPYKCKNEMLCQLQIGYRGYLKLGYMAGLKCVYAHEVYSNDYFEYELGLQKLLKHIPCMEGERGEVTHYYAVYKTTDSFDFCVMSKREIDDYARKYSKTFSSEYSPWSQNFSEMAKKTVLKRALKYYCPPASNINLVVNNDECIRSSISEDILLSPKELVE